MSTVSQYTDGLSGGSVPILGSVVYYTVTGERVKHQVAVDELNDGSYVRIGGEFPAKPPRDADVFKRIASKTKRARVPTNDPDVSRNVLVRDVGTLGSTITRRVVVEDVTKSKKVLNYEQFVDVEFNEISSVVTTRVAPSAPSVPNGLADEVAAEIQSEYNAWRGCLDCNAIREWIRSELKNLHAAVLRRGIYFVSAQHGDALTELTRFVNVLPGGSMFHTLPLVDNGKQRDMLKAAYETEAQEEIIDLMTDVVNTLDSGTKVTEKGFKTKMDQWLALKDKMRSYQSLLNDNLNLASAKMDLLGDVMEEFMSKTDV